ncbi:Hypothetical protein NTJ_02123 [Nesidiocoris tenuis]|uniref:Uncharacterized protein n=1 Tax=Nesidiocoris tenuis TaxID=355587 RepID=A0ABN7AAH5_9HEMI|nr:Hypothetical protein NTJ_02123 [Nesidiocoris tenuis]
MFTNFEWNTIYIREVDILGEPPPFISSKRFSLKMLKEPTASTFELEGYLKILHLLGYWPRSSDHSKCSRIFRNIDYIAWTAFIALPELMIIHTGQKIINAANYFSEKFFNYILHEEDENLIGRPIVLLYATGNKSLALTACNFTIVDHKLGLTLCTACITYFIVLVQFGGSE